MIFILGLYYVYNNIKYQNYMNYIILYYIILYVANIVCIVLVFVDLGLRFDGTRFGLRVLG